MVKEEKKIVGQEVLVQELTRIFEIFKLSECQIRPHFILTGPSGSGKSLTIQSMAKQFELGYLEINAAQLTKEGMSGNSLSKALMPLLQFGNRPTVIFVDEYDKLFISGNSNDSMAHESTTGVQNEFLKVLESETCSVFGDYGKYVNVQSGNLLFVFAGAFNNEEDLDIERLREIGIKTEFLGRVGLVFNTIALSLENLFTILENSALLDIYIKLFPEEKKDNVITIIKAHIEQNFAMNSLGARYVNTLINQYFIKGGCLEKKVVEKASFSTTLTL